MRILLSLAIVAATLTICSSSSEAQSYHDGYQFGSGVRSSYGFFGGCYTPREQPPYFATYPPVYYSGIVRRPYGISPYAAPAGIAPVELSVPQPLTIQNPHFDEVAPVSTEQETTPAASEVSSNKVTWRSNPWLETVVKNN